MEFLENCKIRHSFSARPETAYLCILWKNRKAAIAQLKATIKLNMTSILLQTGQTTTAFKVTGLAKGDKVKSYSSANKKIATIDSHGKIKGIRPGGTKITVTLASGKRLLPK